MAKNQVVIDCAQKIFKALGGDISEDEIKRITELVHARAARDEIDFDEAAKAFVKDVVSDMVLFRKRKRQNIIKTAERRQFYERAFEAFEKSAIFGKPLSASEKVVKVMKSKLQGTYRNVFEGRLGVDQLTRRNEKMLVKNLVSRLGKEDIKALKNRAIEKDIMEEVHQLTVKKGNPGITQNKQALRIAKVVHDINRAELELLNRSGATIRDLDGYIMRQTHDPEKMRRLGKTREEARERWKQIIKPLLDPRKTFKGRNPAEINRFLDEVFDDIVDGRKKNINGGQESDELLKIIGTEKPLAEKLSRARVLHFKDGASTFEYNSQFGRKSLDEALGASIRSTARQAALMKVFGTNPRAAFEADIKRLQTKHEVQLTQSELDDLDSAFRIADGLENRPADNAWLTLSEAEAFINNTSKLGAALFSSITDLPVQAANLMAKTGEGNIFTQMAKVIEADIKIATSPQAQRELLELYDVYFSSILGQSGARWAGSEGHVPGVLSGLQTSFWKLSGISAWTDMNKIAHVHVFSREMAMRSGLRFGELDARMQNSFRNGGIEVAEWEMIRRSKRSTQSLGDIIDAEQIKKLDTNEVRKIMADTGQIDEAQIIEQTFNIERNRFVNDRIVGKKFKDAGDKTKAVQEARAEFDKLSKTDLKEKIDAAIQRRFKRETDKFKDDTVDKLITYLGDQSEVAVPTPGAYERQITTDGRAPDTPGAIARRAFWRFKQFPLTIITKVFPNIIQAKGANTLAEAIADRGSMAIAGQLIAGMTVMGYASMTIKDLLKNKTPRDPTDPKTITAAMIQGGAFSFFGDILLTDWDKYGGNTLLAGLAGPTFAQYNDIGELISAGHALFVTNDGTEVTQEKRRAARAALRLIVNNAPFGNLYFTRGILDHTTLMPLNEFASPGYIQRHQLRLMEERGQRSLIEPRQDLPFISGL